MTLHVVIADDEAVALAGDWGTIRIPHDRIRRSNLMPAEVPGHPRTTGRIQ